MAKSKNLDLLLTVSWENDGVVMIDQTKLPNRLVYVKCKDYKQVADAIKKLVVRGAPAIGVTAAFGLALAAKASKTKKLPEFRKINRRPIDGPFVHSIFNRDHPGCAEEHVIEAFADAILELDDSVPTGTYVDMCSKLPVVDPEKVPSPTIIMRGQFDGIAGVGHVRGS